MQPGQLVGQVIQTIAGEIEYLQGVGQAEHLGRHVAQVTAAKVQVHHTTQRA